MDTYISNLRVHILFFIFQIGFLAALSYQGNCMILLMFYYVYYLAIGDCRRSNCNTGCAVNEVFCRAQSLQSPYWGKTMLLNGKLADIAAMGSALAAFFVFDATACGSGAPRRAQKPSITLDGAIVVDAPPTGVYKRAFTYWAPIIGPGATNIAEAPSSVHTTDHRFQYRGRTIRDGSDEIQYPCCQGHLFDDLRIVPPASAPSFRGSRLQQQRRIVADIFSIGSASAPNELFLGRRVCACSLRILSRLRCHHLSPTSVRTDAAI